MKKLVLNIMILLFPILLSAQSSPIENIISEYSGKEGVTSINLSNQMLQLFSKMAEDESDEELEAIISDLNGIKILTFESSIKPKNGKSLYSDFTRLLSASNYKELMTINDEGENIQFLIRESNSKIKELVMVIGESDETVLIALTGDIDLKNMSELSKSLDIKQLEHLDKVEK